MALSFFKEHQSRWLISGLFLLTILVFAKSLFFEFVWDDIGYLVGKDSYQSAGLKELMLTPINGVEYLPLRDLTYISDYLLWGWNPIGFHLTNLILYILNIWVVYRFTLVLNSTILPSGNTGKTKGAVWVALVTAAIFSVHPLHSEVVSFIHGRNVLLSGLFFFLSCTYFLKFIDSNLRRNIAVSFMFFTFALLSKATVIMLPLILVTLLYFSPVQRPKDYASLLPFFLLAIVFFFIFKFHASESNVIDENMVIVFGSYDFYSRIAVALQIPFFYLAKLLVPIGLSTEYEIEFVRDLFSITGVFAFVVLGLLLSIAYYFRRKFPQVLFALVWFLICLVPVSNFFLTNPVVSDRYVYLSSYAYTYILAVLFYQIGKKTGLSRSLILLIPVLGIHSWLAFERNDVWQSDITVMEDMTKTFSNQTKGYNNLGQHYFEQKQFSRAFENFQKAKEISPALSLLEFYQAGLAYMQHRPLEALELLETALLYNENEAYAWNLRGDIHESQGDLMQAVWSYQKALNSAHTTNSTTEYASDKLQRVKKELEPSLEAARKDILAYPDDLNRKAKFAVMLQSAGFREEAISLYEDLLELGGPNWQVYFNLGLLYVDDKQFDKSIDNYQMSLSLNDTSGMIHNELGVLYKQAGQYDEAMSHFHQAIKLNPESAKPLVNLARLHFQLGNEKPAREAFDRVLVNFPEYGALARTYLLKIVP